MITKKTGSNVIFKNTGSNAIFKKTGSNVIFKKTGSSVIYYRSATECGDLEPWRDLYIINVISVGRR